ncbi:hypothetical protein RF11_00485 [Thelohanellus kitauei]|uniref:Integrase zinc-binding domain-containing protein n=1 Tax=Thelohanellus kitauei TaxID=669202 RepID=A0A0C2MWQ7_THEKT|nr:hypothetical protein RF11_00485 [Thelohanellus kitauei]
MMSIKEFDFTIRHIKGSGNIVADGLSRSTYALKQKSQLIHDDKTKQEIIRSYHEDLAHCGIEKTLEAIRRKYACSTSINKQHQGAVLYQSYLLHHYTRGISIISVPSQQH